MSLKSMLERDEGRSHIAYPDPLTGGAPLTIGVGHTGPEVYDGLRWDDAQIDAAFDADVEEATNLCRAHLPWFDQLDEVRRAVLVAMAFQMGSRLFGFVNMLAAVRDQHYAHAAENMRQSIWARQTPKRALRMALQMEVGAWQ